MAAVSTWDNAAAVAADLYVDSQQCVLQRTRVTVRVPATTANLGPGFDCLGMALDIWNELTVEKADRQSVEVVGEGAGTLPIDDSNLVLVGMKAAFKVQQQVGSGNNRESKIMNEAYHVLYTNDYSDVVLPPFRYICVNRIPFARGLGSSSAAVVSGLVAGLVLTGVELPVAGEEALLNFACAIEGHPDNVAPAIYGGLQLGVSFTDSGGITRWRTSQVPIPNGLQCVLFLPNQIVETVVARAVLPSRVSRDDAVFNLSRVALLVNALATGSLHNLRLAMEDRLHQPQRGSLKNGSHILPLITAAINSGAHSACLSGSGPAILALTSGCKGDIFTQRQGERMDVAVATGMLEAAEQVGMTGRVFITHPSMKGAHVVSADPPFSEGQVYHFSGFDNV